MAAVPAELNTRLAFYWLLLTAARTGEMRFATWGEIEDGKLWRVPAERMKMDREHLVPLSTQAQTVLERARVAQRPRGFGAAIPRIHPARRAIRKCSARPTRPRRLLRPANVTRLPG
ncbi:MAG: tyrosine-type recombinase/integrase, partial [Betaproteobacteria bacterium]|nr:tyrosine-type recombinase/integrase [Betaproteobacteria bacterium]